MSKSNKPIRKLNNQSNRRDPIIRSEEDWHHIAKMLEDADLDAIEQFWINVDIPTRTYEDALKKYDYLAEAHEKALIKIGLKDEKICKKNFLSMNTVIAKGLPDYLPRWKKNVEWYAQLKNALDDNNLEKIKLLMADAHKPL